MKVFQEPLTFEWDKGNKDKNWILHRVTREECEEIFYDPGKKILQEGIHVGEEERHLIVGKTKKERLLFVVFTERGNKLRVISARDLNKKERHLYEEKAETSKIQE